MKQLKCFLFCLIMLLIFTSKAMADLPADSIIIKPVQYKNSVYAEGLGNGVIGSLNYERVVVSRNNKQVALRIGGSYIPVNDKVRYLYAPLELKLRFARNGSSYKEFGFGFTYIQKRENLGFENRLELKETVLPVIRFGGHYQAPNSRFVLKPAFLLFITAAADTDWRLPVVPSVGLAAGFSF